MSIDVLLGLQWGDEGKGKIVDVITPNYDVIARFQGGPNAGHTLEINDKKYVMHTIPSGIFHNDKTNIIGNGVVIDPVIFKEEIDGLDKLDIEVNVDKNIKISRKAHLIMPTHRILDKASEEAKGKTKIGSTQKGIGPAYMDKTGRNGLRVGDIEKDNFIEMYNELIEKHKLILEQYDFNYKLSEYEEGWFEGIETIKRFELIDGEHEINHLNDAKKRILAEGAQGTLLDIDFGSYPYVTSSNTICAGACSGLGIAPATIGDVYGIFKAYCTRVGSGPFPTELHDETGKKMAEIGNEFGATTGRARRCGWMDMLALKYAVMLNGVSHLIMTKADVLTGFETIKACIGYKTKDNKVLKQIPYDIDMPIEPVYKEFPGWSKDISECRNYSELPPEFIDYVSFIENEIGVPVWMISVGPNRNEYIFKA